MFLNCFDRIRGATRKIATRWRQKLAQADLIASDREDQDGSHVPQRSLAARSRKPNHGRHDLLELLAQCGLRRAIRGLLRSDEYVQRLGVVGIESWQEIESHPLAKQTLEAVTSNRCLPVLWHDEADSTRSTLYKEAAPLEMRESEASATLRYGLKFRPVSQPPTPGEFPAYPSARGGCVRFRRTWKAAVP